jgi:outer membrane receptor protein involved in Fe transport
VVSSRATSFRTRGEKKAPGCPLTGGARVEHSGLTNQTLFSPRAAISWSPAKDWFVRFGTGRYYQFPDLEQMFGRLGNPNLRAESATHYNASVERLFGDRLRVLAEVYDREDRDLFFGLSELDRENNINFFIQFSFSQRTERSCPAEWS